MIKPIYLFILFILFCHISNGQNRFEIYEQQLYQLADNNQGLNAKVELSVNEAPIQEFLRGIANAYNLNISVDQNVNMKITTNFSGVTVQEVLLFLVKNYNLDLSFTGSIINVSLHFEAPPPPKEYVPKKLSINYDLEKDELSFDLTNDTLGLVIKDIVSLAGRNIIFTPELFPKALTAFIKSLPFESAMEKLAVANGLAFVKLEDNVYSIEKVQDSRGAEKKKGEQGKVVVDKAAISSSISYNEDSSKITIDASGISIHDLILTVSNSLGKNYFLFSEIKGIANVHIDSTSYDEMLRLLLNGTEYTYTMDNEIYLIGDRSLEGLRKTVVHSFQFRTVDKVIDIIPTELKKGIELKPFPDLNSIILSGSAPRIDEVVKYLRDIDRVVPVIQIEVLIVEVRNTNTVSTGIESGLRDKPTTTGGLLYPTYDMALGSKSINNLIDGINGLGIINLGKVAANFYINLKFLEQQGMLKLRSTPKLATLNGNEATLSIGRTEYYLEVQSSVVGIQNPFPVQSQQYKSVNADLSISINPIVSGDEQITLGITVNQSNFTERISQTAPPGTITREFKSLIRVKNEEMIILGGLDENSTNDSGEGVPFFSRIPVIKWFFSSRTRSKSKNKLTIFIKPTVIY